MAFDPTRIGAEFVYADKNVTVGAGVATPVVGPNAYRVAMFVATITNNIFFRPIGPASATLGFTVLTGANPFFQSIQQIGPLIQQSWSAFAAAGTTLYVLEVLWQPPGGSQ